jgi:hypothetical protein
MYEVRLSPEAQNFYNKTSLATVKKIEQIWAISQLLAKQAFPILLADLSMQKSKLGADLNRKSLSSQHFGVMSIALIAKNILSNQFVLKLAIAFYKKRLLSWKRNIAIVGSQSGWGLIVLILRSRRLSYVNYKFQRERKYFPAI